MSCGKPRQQMDQNVDHLLQRDRLTERRVDELDAKVRDDIAARQYKSSWAQRIHLDGDLRLRYQSDMPDKGNDERVGEDRDGNGTYDYEPTDIDRDRWRYRARLGLKANLIDPREINAGKVEVGLRLSTGNEDDPVSTNETFGDMFNKDSLVLDRAYLKWSWSPVEQVWGDKIPQLSFIGGRMPNPFFSTDLVWDSDLNFEGLALKFMSDTFSGNSWSSFLTVGVFPLDEFEYNDKEKWLYGAQIGIAHKPFWGLNYKLAVALYAYENMQGKLISEDELDDFYYDGDWSAVNLAVVQGSNSIFDANRLNTALLDEEVLALASDFKELNLTLMVDVDRFFPIHIIFLADYVRNLGNDKEEMLRLDPSFEDYELEQDTGYRLGLTVGYPTVRAAGEWNISFIYKYLEADAVLDAFTDSDFHLGGTDAEGYIIGFQLGVYKNVWLDMRYMSTNEIIEERGAWAVDTLQVDLNAEF